MNRAKQKLYTSIEIDEKFADSGEAYLVGLAVTDTPASLGTEVLAFCMQKPEANPYKDRHFSATSMFTESIELAGLTFEEVEDAKPGIGAQLLSNVKKLLTGKQVQTDEQFAQVAEAVEAVAEHVKDIPEQFTALQGKHGELAAQLKTLSTDYAAFKEKLSKDPAAPERPLATGGNGQVLTDC
ncbi:GPO family capsid scaffolding protein [Pseudomonas knackmussii]|uniref:GPO family capsid scaffolding protein n=1 Tax=Pseudomonas knackmussii TaxID=65741 RepID=UPI003F4A1481